MKKIKAVKPAYSVKDLGGMGAEPKISAKIGGVSNKPPPPKDYGKGK